MRTHHWHRFFAFAVAAALLFPAAAMAAPPVVKTVPWVANIPLIPHDTWSGKSIRLKGTSNQAGANIQYSWDFGDGSPVTAPATVTTGNQYGLEASHVYTGPAGTVFTARLTVRNTTTGEIGSKEYYVIIQDKTLGVEVNVAIDEGLWYLHKTMTRSGSEGYWAYNYWAETPANLNAFFVNGHLETGDPNNPYTETVQRGMRRLFTNLSATAIGNQTYPAPIGTVNPDSNGNGLAIRSRTDESYNYAGGIYMDAIVASGTPDAVAPTGGANVIGRKYKDIVQDMVDGYAYGQTDSGTWMGGWGYDWNNGNSDNSVNQWAAIGLLGGESVISNGPDGIPHTPDDVAWAVVPAFVKTANKNSLNNTQCPTAGTNFGAFSYTNTNCYFPWGPYGTTPAGMVQMVLDGIGRGNAQWDRTENFIRTNFCSSSSSSYYSLRRYYYGLFSFTKAMLLTPGGGIQFLANQPGGANPIDWYAAQVSAGDPCNGVARTLLGDQLAAGNWGLHNDYGYHTYLSTAWAIIMLNRTVFESGVPVAVAKATPNPAIAGQIVQLDGSTSFHQDGGKLIDSWEWDLDNDGAFDDASGPFASVSFPVVGSYPVKLRVTDNGTPEKVAETTVTVLINTPPIAPTAKAGGPYKFCPAAAPWYLDGGGSINPDEGQSEAHDPPYPGDTIVSYLWDLDGDGLYDDASGKQPDVTAFFTGKGPGSYLIQLKVTDRTATSYPSSGFPDLSDTDSGVVVVLSSTDPGCACVSNLQARAKPDKVQLTWSHNGAHHYNVYRGTVSGGPYLKIGSTTSTYSTYLDMTVVNGTTYYYVIRPANLLDQESCQSNQASARPVAR